MFPNKGIPGGCGIGVVIAMSDAKSIWVIEISEKRRSALERERGRIVAGTAAASAERRFFESDLLGRPDSCRFG